MGLADGHKRQRRHLHRHPLGVLNVTPPVLSWLAEPQAIWRRRWISVALPLVGALALAFGYTRTQEGERHAVDQGGHGNEDGSITDELSVSMKKALAVGCTDDGVIGQEKPMSFPALLL